MAIHSPHKSVAPGPTAEDTLHGPPDGDYRPASPGEATLALGQDRRVYAMESFDGGWGQVADIETLLEQGRRTPACTVRFVDGRVKVVLDGHFLVERERRSA
jgi:hypothetical protein